MLLSFFGSTPNPSGYHPERKLPQLNVGPDLTDVITIQGPNFVSPGTCTQTKNSPSPERSIRFGRFPNGRALVKKGFLRQCPNPQEAPFLLGAPNKRGEASVCFAWLSLSNQPKPYPLKLQALGKLIYYRI